MSKKTSPCDELSILCNISANFAKNSISMIAPEISPHGTKTPFFKAADRQNFARPIMAHILQTCNIQGHIVIAVSPKKKFICLWRNNGGYENGHLCC
jgi:hypothetical protein